MLGKGHIKKLPLSTFLAEIFDLDYFQSFNLSLECFCSFQFSQEARPLELTDSDDVTNDDREVDVERTRGSKDVP